MNKNENMKQLKMAVTNHRPLKITISLLGTAIYQFVDDKNLGKIYQYEFGCLKVDTVLKAIDGLVDFIKVELPNG